MDPYAKQHILLHTGSFTGLRPLQELGSGYLTAASPSQPLCGNPEGWGPLSPHRYDFTPCFIDVWAAAVSAYGLVFGLLAVWWLRKKKPLEQAGSRNLAFWFKQVSAHGMRRRRAQHMH